MGEYWWHVREEAQRSRSACTCAGRVMCHFQQLWSLKPALKAVQKTWPQTFTYPTRTRLRGQQMELMETLTCETANWVNALKNKNTTTNEYTSRHRWWLDSIPGSGFAYDVNTVHGLLLSTQMFHWSYTEMTTVSCQHRLNTIRHLVWQISTAMATWQRPANNSTNVMATMMAGDRWRRDVSEKAKE